MLDIEALRGEAEEALQKLNRMHGAEDLAAAKDLVETLRNAREWPTMGRLVEAISRLDIRDAKNRRLYAQYLIETGRATAAADMLTALAQRLPPDHRELSEVVGLLGRVYKQIFLDAADKTSDMARDALERAIANYRWCFEENRAHTWHGVNLAALLRRSQKLGLAIGPDLNPELVARDVVAAFEATPESERGEWYLPTLAEAKLALSDYDAVEGTIREYAAQPCAKAFLIASTLRQFTELWGLEDEGERGRGIVAALRARLLSLPGGSLEIKPRELQRLRTQPAPESGQLQAILGERGPKTYRWWRAGLDRALGVAAIRRRFGNRVGTGFIVRAGDFGLAPPDELLVMTNFHVVNPDGIAPGIAPEQAEVVFDALDASREYPVENIVWCSAMQRHDVAILRLQGAPPNVRVAPVATVLPTLEAEARVYIIGHPGGRDLAFSFQDNELLDHEGPPGGTMHVPGVSRVHYRAPTEGGSSGSPVFDDSWNVIALHHRGGKEGMSRLNGRTGTYAANEGISIQSIRQAVGNP